MRKDRLDGVLIDVDEDGFHLILSGEQAEYDFALPSEVAEELMRAVRREIEPWYLEGHGSLREKATSPPRHYELMAGE